MNEKGFNWLANRRADYNSPASGGHRCWRGYGTRRWCLSVSEVRGERILWRWPDRDWRPVL